MPYSFDAFISYRRANEWPAWVEKKFMPVFKHYLHEEIGREPRIFIDYEIAEGDDWPARLASALSESRILVGLWTPSYFLSEWCKCEMACMHAREKEYGFRTPDKPDGLIVPASLHDGDRFPAEAQRIQQASLRQCSNIRVADGSKTAEELTNRIIEWTPKIARAISNAPDYEENWKNVAYNEFIEIFESSSYGQSEPPQFG